MMATGNSDSPPLGPEAEASRDGSPSETFFKVLKAHAHGGTDAAVRASDSTSQRSVQALPAAGVKELIDWMRNHLEGGPKSRTPLMAYLVGGPGGGKSAAAAQVVQGLAPLGPESPLAERSYRYASPAGNLTVINDATIPKQANKGSLAHDIDEAASAGENLLACVNRGVIVDDLGRAQRDASSGEEQTAGVTVLRWLAQPFGQDPRSDPSDRWCIRSDSGEPWSFLRSGSLKRSGEHVAQLLVVFLDECSLLEVRPETTLSESGPVAGEYSVARFDALEPTSNSSGYDLLSKILELASQHQDPLGAGSNPVTANIASLTHERIRRNFLHILRAAEIIGERRFSYRDLWAVYSRALLGSLVSHDSIDSASTSMEVDMEVAGNNAYHPTKRWASAQRLGQLRFFMSVFAPTSGTEGPTSVFDQLASMVRTADPASDAPLGHLDKDAPSRSGWATPVYDAFSVIGKESSPLNLLRPDLDPDLKNVVGPLETIIDRAYQSLQTSSNADLEDDRRRASQWYGRYLLRLYAVSKGIPALYNEVTTWSRAWRTSKNDGTLNETLTGGLTSLLNPRRSESQRDTSYVPTFASRAEPVTSTTTHPILVTQLGDMQFRTRVEGERIWVHVADQSSDAGKIALDLDLIRLILTVSGQHSGITEMSSTISPRLERIRSARLRSVNSGPNPPQSIRVMSGKSTYPVAVVKGPTNAG